MRYATPVFIAILLYGASRPKLTLLVQQQPQLGLEAVHGRWWGKYIVAMIDQSMQKQFGNLSMARRLEFAVNATALSSDVAALNAKAGHGEVHAIEDPDWKVLFLIKCDSDIGKASWSSCRKTESWDTSAYLRHLLEPLEGVLGLVRISNLFPGSHIYWHIDTGLPFAPTEREQAFCRLAFIVNSPSEAHTRVGTQFIQMLLGEVWCADYSVPHTVYNLGSEVRTRVIVDVAINETLLRKSVIGRATLEAHKSLLDEVDEEGRSRKDIAKTFKDAMQNSWGPFTWLFPEAMAAGVWFVPFLACGVQLSARLAFGGWVL